MIGFPIIRSTEANGGGIKINGVNVSGDILWEGLEFLVWAGKHSRGRFLSSYALFGFDDGGQLFCKWHVFFILVFRWGGLFDGTLPVFSFIFRVCICIRVLPAWTYRIFDIRVGYRTFNVSQKTGICLWKTSTSTIGPKISLRLQATVMTKSIWCKSRGEIHLVRRKARLSARWKEESGREVFLKG
mgnify:CR=1 FL=1